MSQQQLLRATTPTSVFQGREAAIQVWVLLQNSPIYAEWNYPLLSIGPVPFHFKGCWVVFLIFIQILIEHPVSK